MDIRTAGIHIHALSESSVDGCCRILGVPIKHIRRKYMGNVYAYVRVSTTGQHEDRQLIAMARQDVPEKNIFVEKQSGKDFNRPMYQKMVKRLKADDVLFIKSIDRLGRTIRKFWNSGGFSPRKRG